MDVKEIVKDWLKQRGYDGLAGDDCGCALDDLMPCGEYGSNCVAGKKVECIPSECYADGDCDWHIEEAPVEVPK